jgi:large subunit ribosomal protein L4
MNMSKAIVYNQAGEKTSEMDLNSKVFGVEKIDAALVHAAVRVQRNNLRSPLAHTKMMGEVAGSGKKPWKQKGTGRARAGSARSPLWRHGGITFGPRNDRDYSLKMNRSEFRKALFTVLTDKVASGKLVVVEKIESLSKTSALVKALEQFASKTSLNKKRLLILADHDKNLENASANIPNTKVLTANNLNIVDLLNHDVIVAKDALAVIEKTYLKTTK